MDIFTRHHLQKLMERPAGPAVSIYLPTFRVGREVEQNRIRFKNLLDQAREQLQAMGVRRDQRQEILTPTESLEQDALFWQQQSDGLAMFLAPAEYYAFRVPLNFSPLAAVTDRFHIKPLLPLISLDGLFYILAISLSQVRLFQGTRQMVDELDLHDVPQGLAEALRFDDPEKQLQFHTGTTDRRGERAAVFHGHGVGSNDAQDNIRRYFLKIDHGLQSILAEEQAMLVLAGVNYLMALYREVNSYRHLAEEDIAGSPEQLSAEDLHRQAWAIVEPHLQQQEQEALDRYQQLRDTERTIDTVAEIVPAAHAGRVETLFVARGVVQWGTWDRQRHQVQEHHESAPGDQDLLDLATLQTLLNGGVVYVVEPEIVPAQTPVAAVLRY